jgi:hypothetical protein
LDHTWVLLVIAGVVAQIFKAMKKKEAGVGEGDDEGQSAEPPKEYQFEDPELAERTRRIREEIQRKIAQRQRGMSPAEPAQTTARRADEPQPSMVEPPPMVREVVVAPVEPPRTSTTRAAAARAVEMRTAEILEQQAAWAEKLREAQLMRGAAKRRTAFEEETMNHEPGKLQVRRGELLDDLRDPLAQRRAFILREVLGPPVGLR